VRDTLPPTKIRALSEEDNRKVIIHQRGLTIQLTDPPDQRTDLTIHQTDPPDHRTDLTIHLTDLVDLLIGLTTPPTEPADLQRDLSIHRADPLGRVTDPTMHPTGLITHPTGLTAGIGEIHSRELPMVTARMVPKNVVQEWVSVLLHHARVQVEIMAIAAGVNNRKTGWIKLPWEVRI
jgi:hypothetical protein